MEDDDSPFPPWPLAWHPRADGDRPDPARFVTPACCGDGFRIGGGLWTSPMIGRRHSVWSIYHDREKISAQKVRQGWALDWPDPARTARIDTGADLHALVAEFGCREHHPLESIGLGFPPVVGLRGDGALAVHDSRQWPPLDFAAMSEHFDALYLSEAGREATWMTNPGTTAWSCETVLWLNPVWQLREKIHTIRFRRKSFHDDLLQSVAAL